MLNASHLGYVELGKIILGWRGEAAVATFARVLLFGVPHDRQDNHPSRTFHHRLHRQIRPPPSKLCVCSRNNEIMIWWKYSEVFKLWLDIMEISPSLTPSYLIFKGLSLQFLVRPLIPWMQMIGWELWKISLRLLERIKRIRFHL